MGLGAKKGGPKMENMTIKVQIQRFIFNGQQAKVFITFYFLLSSGFHTLTS